MPVTSLLDRLRDLILFGLTDRSGGLVETFAQRFDIFADDVLEVVGVALRSGGVW